MVRVPDSGGSFGRDVSAVKARQPARNDGEWSINAHRAPLFVCCQTARQRRVFRDVTEEEAGLQQCANPDCWALMEVSALRVMDNDGR